MGEIGKQLTAFEKLDKFKTGALFMKMGARKIKSAFDLIKFKQHEIDFCGLDCSGLFLVLGELRPRNRGKPAGT